MHNFYFRNGFAASIIGLGDKEDKDQSEVTRDSLAIMDISKDFLKWLRLNPEAKNIYVLFRVAL